MQNQENNQMFFNEEGTMPASDDAAVQTPAEGTDAGEHTDDEPKTEGEGM